MKKMLITLALIAAPALAMAQQPAQPKQTPAAAHDSTKAKPKATRHAATSKKSSRTARDTTKAKAAAPAQRDTTKKPN